ncbi:MAG: hypothetical protein JXQ26_11270 [Tissierellales bacterium]|nr:hypothetical protein [Tissierellales bacterium]
MPDSQLNDKETIQLAERNIEDFVNLMSRNSPGRIHRRSLDPDYLGFMVNESLDISAFKLALRGFCPRFPFC